MTESESFEYENVDHETYYKSQKVAIDILAEISKSFSIPVSRIRYSDIINYFFKYYDIQLLLFEDKNEGLLNINSGFGSEIDLYVFNSTMSTKGINVKAHDIKLEDPQFTDRVDGLTMNQDHTYVMLINFSKNFFPRIIFTILHELSHVYLSEINNNYLRLVAKINACNFNGDPYPAELKPIETDANIIASELFANKLALEKAIDSNYTFDDMRLEFGMSKGALHNRILNYLEHSQHFDCSLAKDCTFEIRNNGKNGIETAKGLICSLNGGYVHNPNVKLDAFDDVIFL